MGRKKTKAITDYSFEELTELVTGAGQPAFRARQIFSRVHHNLSASWDEFSELPGPFRESLAGKYPLLSLEMKTIQTSRDGTEKALFALSDGRTIEAALMLYRRTGGTGRRGTVCVSTQVGCAVGCPFCATGRGGFERNLSSGEIVEQVLYFARRLKDKQGDSAITNIVFMGMGEPLANYDELMKSIRILNAPEGMNIGARSMTVSTAGAVPGIRKLASEKMQVGLAVSLHAGTDNVRNRLVPLNRKYPIDAVLEACGEYFQHTGRRVTYEYILFKGINDSLGEAGTLGKLLNGQNCHVNLIPANDTGRGEYVAPSHGEVLAFMVELKKHHVNATIRHSRGQDIDAGCGQLRSRVDRTEEGRKTPGTARLLRHSSRSPVKRVRTRKNERL